MPRSGIFDKPSPEDILLVSVLLQAVHSLQSQFSGVRTGGKIFRKNPSAAQMTGTVGISSNTIPDTFSVTLNTAAKVFR